VDNIVPAPFSAHEGRPVTPQEIVERALAAAAHLHGCAVLVRETSEAVLRWANSTMTTNGHSTAMRVTVMAFVAVEGGVAAGVVGTAAATEPAELVVAAEAAARCPRRAAARRTSRSPYGAIRRAAIRTAAATRVCRAHRRKTLMATLARPLKPEHDAGLWTATTRRAPVKITVSRLKERHVQRWKHDSQRQGNV
jgi:hypothetical protein